jgi:glycosyltransferase involved in cell wall biosynthesis
MDPSSIPPCVHQCRVVVQGISPLIWRRLLVRRDMSLATLHAALQVVFAWSDTSRHSFHIHGKAYGTPRLDGPHIEGEVRHVPLDPRRVYPVCTGGKRAGPPQDGGGAWADLQRVDQPHSPLDAMATLATALERLQTADAQTTIVVPSLPSSVRWCSRKGHDHEVHSSRGDHHARRMTQLRAKPELDFPIVGLGVDRLDYTKGIVSRFQGIERFLEKYPEYQGRFCFVQIAVPSRTQIDEYRQVKEQIENLVGRINDRFGSETHKPVHYRYEHIEPPEMVVYYRLADFAMVSSLHDGMNLVAKEFVASQVECKGVLICSEFAGAAEELDNALLINPYDVESVADTLKHAIEMPTEERSRRMARLQEHISEHNIYKWLAENFIELDRIRREEHGTAFASGEAPRRDTAALPSP